MAEMDHDVWQKLSFMEKRAMAANMVPHEACRQMVSILREFNPRLDVQYCLRQLRDISLVYVRNLGEKYVDMSFTEKMHCVRLILYEACQRYWVYECRGAWYEEDKYNAIIELCCIQEEVENSFSTETRLFSRTLRSHALIGGYEHQHCFQWLRDQGSAEAKFEMQCLISENNPEVSRQMEVVKQNWLQDVEAEQLRRHNRAAEESAAAEAAAVAEAAERAQAAPTTPEPTQPEPSTQTSEGDGQQNNEIQHGHFPGQP